MKNKFEYKEALSDDYKPLKKIKVFFNGFWYVLKYDLSVTYKVIISLITLLTSLLLNQYLNFIIILMATGNMLSMEIANSCVELLCDFHKTGYDERIKVIKDVASVPWIRNFCSDLFSTLSKNILVYFQIIKIESKISFELSLTSMKLYSKVIYYDLYNF